MIRYAVAWRKHTDNLGDDLVALAARSLLPRVDCLVDVDAPDAPLPGLRGEDRVVTLMGGSLLRRPYHWPPEPHIAPVMVGAHFSREDAWGIPFGHLDGAAKAALTACGPIACRDDSTRELMEASGVPCTLTAGLTLTLKRPETEKEDTLILCDLPQEAAQAAEALAGGTRVERVTHHLQDAPEDFARRMEDAQALVRRYAAARCVITRRLHCAMTCLALGTPVLMVYNSDYEDVGRFAPMNGMVRTMSLRDFLEKARAGRFSLTWENPPGAHVWREKLTRAAAEGIARAEEIPLPLVPPEDAAAWRARRLLETADSAREKIRRLERERYDALREKFSLLIREDAAKAALSARLEEPPVQKALRQTARLRYLARQPWYARPWIRLMLRLGRRTLEDPVEGARGALRSLGWPEGKEP